MGLTEPQAREQYGDDQVKVYKSSFTAMYTAVTQHRQPCRMKLVCVGPEEKIVGIHGIGSFDEKGYIRVDKFQNTSVAGIYAVGDNTGAVELTPVAVAASRRLSERLFNNKPDEHLDYSNIPTVVFALVEVMQAEGPQLHTEATPKAVVKNADGSLTLQLENGSEQTVDCLVWAVGREPATDNLNLDVTGVASVPGAEYGIDSDGFFELGSLPRRVAVVGAGYIAVELAGVVNALGAETHLFVRKHAPLRSFDPLLSERATLVKNRSAYIDRIHTSYDNVLGKNKVEVIKGFARFVDAHTVEVNGETITADHILIATGGRPVRPSGIASINRAAMHGQTCALIEAKELGGTCVNVGCVPKKVMWHAAQIAEAIHLYGPDYGFDTTVNRFDPRRCLKKSDA
ncbi:hypothetical protein CRX72_27485 [Pantoea sp. BRM17]|nr:hypothetical protein CRX72_27485 [Pantoea sp. BRM17]